MFRPIDTGLLILRISTSLLMLPHGINKIFKGVGSIGTMLIEQNLPAWLAWGVYVTEIIAPIMILIGFRTRLAAFVFAGNMIVAVWLAHPEAIWMLTKHGAWGIELQALYFFASLVLVFTGSGRYALSRNKWGD